ncbi:MAG TPA: copper resistance CopC family protein [bacterium]|nr:copper resistance CopC family protein [bacterium]
MDRWFRRLRLFGAACVVLSTVFAYGWGTPANAHAFLNASVPAADSTVTAPLKEIKLTYSEPVEIRFSIFKLYKINAAPGADLHALHAAADALFSQNLLKRGDEAARADAGLANTGGSSTDIVVRLRDLEPGAYVLMWRALSVDTHTTQGSFVFVYTPAP